MDLRVELFQKIRALGVPRGTIASLTGCYVSELSAWLNRGVSLPQAKIQRVKTVVADLEHTLSYFSGIPLDLRDPAFLERLILGVRQAEETEALDAALKGFNSLFEQEGKSNSTA